MPSDCPRIRSARAAIVAALFVISLAACADGSPTDPGGSQVGGPVATIALTPGAAIVAPGRTLALATTLRDADGLLLANRSVRFSSSAPAVATVNSSSGIVTGIANGTTTITATSEGKSATASVHVGAELQAMIDPSAGPYSCGLTVNGVPYCWGLISDNGQLFRELVPTPLQGAHVFTSLAATYAGGCGLGRDSTAYCWGSNYEGLLGDGTSVARLAPMAVSGGHKFVAIEAGSNVVAALTADGRLYRWGYDWNYMAPGYQRTPLLVATSQRFVSLSGGASHFLMLTAQGAAYAIGHRCGNHLGDGAPMQCGDVELTPVLVAGGHTFTRVSAGNNVSAALNAQGHLYWWGSPVTQANDYPTQSATPTRLMDGRIYRAVSAGGEFILGETTAGNVYGWGKNTDGQLGDGTRINRATPVLLAGGQVVASVKAGVGHSFALTLSGGSLAWGFDSDGRLGTGRGDQYYQLTPFVSSPPGITLTSPGATALFQGGSATILIAVSRGGGFNTTAPGGAGEIALSVSGLPSGVTVDASSLDVPVGASAGGIALTASASAKTGTATVTVVAVAAGAPSTSTTFSLTVQATARAGSLNLVCASGSTNLNAPGYHCMTNSSNLHVPGKFAIADLPGGNWVEQTAEVCVSWGASGQATARFKAGVGGGSTTVTTGEWGLISRRDGTLEPAPGGGHYLFTAALDAQTQLLVWNPTTRTITGYNFVRGTCPW